jgi:ACT domain
VAEAAVNIRMISQGASEINISFVVKESDVPRAVQHLHQHFFPGKANGSAKARRSARKMKDTAQRRNGSASTSSKKLVSRRTVSTGRTAFGA